MWIKIKPIDMEQEVFVNEHLIECVYKHPNYAENSFHYVAETSAKAFLIDETTYKRLLSLHMCFDPETGNSELLYSEEKLQKNG